MSSLLRHECIVLAYPLRLVAVAHDRFTQQYLAKSASAEITANLLVEVEAVACQYIAKVGAAILYCCTIWNKGMESGSYVLYGYFTPYSGAPETFTIDNCFTAVVHLNAGSHVMVYNPRNFKLDCYEVLVSEDTAEGYTYTKVSVSILDVSALLENGGGSITYAKEVELLAANWQTEKEGRYYQTFDIPKANTNSKMDVGLSETALEIMQDKVLTITATFRDGVTRVYALGDKPTQDFVVHISFEDVVWL